MDIRYDSFTNVFRYELGAKVKFVRSNGQIWSGIIVGRNRLTGEIRITYEVYGLQKGNTKLNISFFEKNLFIWRIFSLKFLKCKRSFIILLKYISVLFSIIRKMANY